MIHIDNVFMLQLIFFGHVEFSVWIKRDTVFISLLPALKCSITSKVSRFNNSA